MRCAFRFLLPMVLALTPACSLAKTVVFWQPGFPAADSSAPNEAALRAAFAGAEFADADHLSGALAAPDDGFAGAAVWIGVAGGGLGRDSAVSGSRRESDCAGRKGLSRARHMRTRTDGICGPRARRRRWNCSLTATRRRRDPMRWRSRPMATCFRSCRRLGGSGRSVRWCGSQWSITIRAAADRRRRHGSDDAGLGRARRAQAGGSGAGTGSQCESLR